MVSVPKTLVAHMVDTFKRSGQSAGEFLAELRALTPEDREWYRREMVKAGYVITDPVK